MLLSKATYRSGYTFFVSMCVPWEHTFKHKTTGKNSIKHSCAIFWAHREPTYKHRIKLFFVSSCNWTNKYTELCQNTHLGEYPQKILRYVLIERKLSRKQSDVYHYIGSMTKWPCLIYQLLSVSLMLIQVKKREKTTLCSWSNNH